MSLHDNPSPRSLVNDANAAQTAYTSGQASARGNLVSGKVTLAAGTVTLAIPGLTAASIVQVSLLTPGGTMGARIKAVPGVDKVDFTAVDATGALVNTDTSTLQYTIHV